VTFVCSPRRTLSIYGNFKQNHSMDNQTGRRDEFRGWVQWAMRPPQSVAAYLLCLFLVAGISFYVGTFRPKKPVGMGPAPILVPAK
jgi:hypothetical protein